jgi:hydrogenase maturation factor HypE
MGIIDKLNKDFESRIRLGLMSVLMVKRLDDFTEMKALLNTTDGNLESLFFFRETGYIEIKRIVGKKPKPRTE